MLNLEDIRNLCSGELSIGKPLAPLMSFRIGGTADIFLEPASTNELADILKYFLKLQVPLLLLGNGTNMLISDDGFRGAVLRLGKGFSAVELDGNTIIAHAGVRLSKFVNFAVVHAFAGVEMLAGIPGTLGGAILINAGAYGGEISDHLIDVTILRNGELLTLAKADCAFRYRNSDLKNDVILSARFRLPTGDVEELQTRKKELLLKRNAAQPVNYPNAGSIFKNPAGNYAARLIEHCGLKGLRFGGAVVSELHANFIVNDNGAGAADVIALMNRIRRRVYEHNGIVLEPEIKLIGFSGDPLDALL